MENKYYFAVAAKSSGKSQTAIEKIMASEEAGYKVVFINPPRYGKTTCDADILDALRKHVYDLHAIKEPNPLEEYLQHLYPIEPPKPKLMNADYWFKANPFIEVTQLNHIFIKIEKEEKGE